MQYNDSHSDFPGVLYFIYEFFYVTVFASRNSQMNLTLSL